MPENSDAQFQPSTDKKQELDELDRCCNIAKYAMCGEFLFILLPLIIIAIVEVSKGSAFRVVFESTEWSLGAAILFGQTIVKLVAGFSNIKPETWEKPSLFVALIIVLGLVPTLTVLALSLALDPVPSILKAIQFPIFIYGAVVFFFLGTAGHVQCRVKTKKTRRARSQA